MAVVRLGAVVLDTDDPAVLARFYSELLGWPAHEQEEDWVCLTGPGGVELACQLAIGHRPPTWPGSAIPQQLHIDFTVRDLAGAVARAEALGAQRATVPASEYVIVLIDPSGHPFCLCLDHSLRTNTVTT